LPGILQTAAQRVGVKREALVVTSATLLPHLDLNYEEMIRVMDVLRSQNVKNIGVLQAKGI
jgi:biopolymer transport protein ExbD